jgi:hypothetical protein
MTGKPKVQLRPPPSVDDFVAGDAQASDVQTPIDAQTLRRANARTSRRGIVARKYGERRRMTLYLAPAVAKRLTVYCAAEGRELSHVVNEAVEAYLREGQ